MDDPWVPIPVVPERIVGGDMPGDVISITVTHVRKAEAVFPFVLHRIRARYDERVVVSCYGGSGAGKSEIASLIAYFAGAEGIPAYVLSGDNYPRRAPAQNDAERLNVYRTAGLAALAGSAGYRTEWCRLVKETWDSFDDAAPELVEAHPYLEAYQRGGREALRRYLGTQQEIDYVLVNAIISAFRSGRNEIAVKRLGRTNADVSFELIDFSPVKLLVLEWTHGNSEFLRGIDLPILLRSTPDETLSHRRSRSRDSNVDSAFTRLVLRIEQELIDSRAGHAAVVVESDGSVTANGRRS